MTKQKHFYLIRGLIREARHWGDLPLMLQQTFGECNVTTIDIPGAGDFYKSPSPLSIKEMVDRMRLSFLSKTSEGEEAILVAISLGGMIAAEWMRAYPNDFSRGILINTSYGGISPMFERLKPSALATLLKVPILKGREKESHILKLVSNHETVFEQTLNLWETIQAERPVSLSNTLRQLLAGAFFKVGDFSPSIPILILTSIQDRMVSVECSRAIAKRWNASIKEHPTAGHDLSADDPKWIVEKIKDFVTVPS